MYGLVRGLSWAVLLAVAQAAPAETTVHKFKADSGETTYAGQAPVGADSQVVELPPQPPEAQLEAARKALDRELAAFEERREGRGEASKEQQLEERRAEARATNCKRARDNLAALQAASRRLLLDDQGNAVRLTEEQRQQRMDRAREAIEKYCGD